MTINFGTFKKNALPDEIRRKILDLIQERQLHPGDKLPPERELAAMMHVSRPPLREALRALSAMNIIEIRYSDGAYITSLQPELLVEHLDFVFSLDDSTFLELFDARKTLEVGIVGLAAERITDDEIMVLEACLAKSAEVIADHATFLAVDLELHKNIAKAARNPIMARFMASISRLSTASRARTVEISGVAQQTMKDHQAIVTALKSHDVAAAQAAMLNHLQNVERRFKASLEEVNKP